MGSILKGRNNTYKVRNFQEFETERKRTVCFGLETISYRPPQLWSLLPELMGQLNSIDQFKRSTAQKMKFSIKDFFSKCDQIRRKLRIWSHLLRESLMENFIFCAVKCNAMDL